jgi:hypothetical protein
MSEEDKTPGTAIAVRERPVARSEVAIWDSSDFDHMKRVAIVLAQSGLVPETISHGEWVDENGKKMNGYLGDAIVGARCTLICNQARLWGADPLNVLQCTSLINGRLMYEGKLVNAVVQHLTGVKLRFELGRWETDHFVEVADKSETHGVGEQLAIRCFDPEDPAREVSGSVGMWKTTRSGNPWSNPGNWPRQLRYRASREWARAYEPGAILGIVADGDGYEDLGTEDRPRSSGVMARLSGDQAGAGFDHESVIEQTEKPKRARKPKDEPAPEIEVVVEPQPEQATEIEDDDEGQPIEEGHAAPGEIYIHTEDTVQTTDGRYMTFRDGARFSSTAEPLKFKVYAEHSPEPIEEEESPTTAAEPTETDGAPPAEPEPDTSEPAEDASDDGQPQEEDSGQSAPLESDTDGLPPELAAYVSQIDTCKSWADAKTVMQQFYATDFFKGLKDFTKNEIRAQTWTTLKEVGVKTPDPITDVSAFRLFIEAVDDIEAISGAFSFLKKDQDAKFSEKAPATQAAIADAVADRIAALRGA